MTTTKHWGWGIAAACFAAAVGAQGYPAKPLRLVIPFPPGGSNDIVGRMVATQLSERLGQTIVVDNRAGAGGIIGTEMVAKAPADGYSLLLISVAYAFNTSLYKKIPYDPERSFAPVSILATGPVALAVHQGLPVSSTAELIALAKQKPGALQFASAGVGSFQHLAGELFRLQTGINVVHIPYKGGGPAALDVIAGHAHYQLGSLIQTLPHHRAGKLKVLATSGAQRSPILPEIPTIAETVPGYAADNWWGILVAAATPQPIIDRLHKEIAAVLTTPETQKRFAAEGAQVVQGMAAAEFGKFIVSETSKWARAVRESKITGD